MEKLFNDSETMENKRPTKATDQQIKQVLMDTAQELMEYSGCIDARFATTEGIYEELAEFDISYRNSGFDLAKEFESSLCVNYIDSYVVEIFEGIDNKIESAITQNQKNWVKIFNIKPEYAKGDKLKVNETIGNSTKPGEAYIITVYEDKAKYVVNTNPKEKGGFVYNFEEVESKTTKL